MIGLTGTQSTTFRELREDLLASLIAIRESATGPQTHEHRHLFSAAHKWVREHQAPETVGNLESLRFYAGHADRIRRAIIA